LGLADRFGAGGFARRDPLLFWQPSTTLTAIMASHQGFLPITISLREFAPYYSGGLRSCLLTSR
jgi:hypothetical protein